MPVAINNEGAELRLCIQALSLGAASPNLYGACIELQDETIVLTSCIAAAMPADERTELALATTVIAEFRSATSRKA